MQQALEDGEPPVSPSSSESSQSGSGPPAPGQPSAARHGTSSSEEVPDLRPTAGLQGGAVALPPGAVLAQHRVLGTIQLLRAEGQGRLCCGRSISELIVPLELPEGQSPEAVASEGRVCAVCRSSALGPGLQEVTAPGVEAGVAAGAGGAGGPPCPAGSATP